MEVNPSVAHGKLTLTGVAHQELTHLAHGQNLSLPFSFSLFLSLQSLLPTPTVLCTCTLKPIGIYIN